MVKIKIPSLENAYEDYIFCMNQSYEVADYIAINISSPNTEGLRELTSNEFIERLICEINSEKKKLEKKFNKMFQFFKIIPR